MAFVLGARVDPGLYCEILHQNLSRCSLTEQNV
jgi:hypothetical protein